MAVRFPVLYFSFGLFALLGGCAVVPPEQEIAETRAANEQMLREQQFMLAQFAGRLDELLDSHYELNDKVESMQQEIWSVTQVVSSELKTLRDSQPQNAKTKSKTKKMVVAQEILPPPNKVVLGRYEWVWLDLLRGALKARTDTGAPSSTIDCLSVQPFERDGEKWVRFRVADISSETAFETPVMSYTKTRQSGASDESDRRPVVKLTVRFGDLSEEAEFILVERESSPYPVLLGRNFLRDIALVDVAKKFTQRKYTPPATNSVATP